MCRSTWIAGRARSAGGPRGCRAGRGGGRDPRVDLLDLVGDLVQSRDGARPLRQRLAQRRALQQPLELAGERDRVAGREQQPALAVADQLLVDRRSARRPGPFPWRAPGASARAPVAGRRRRRRGRRRPRSALGRGVAVRARPDALAQPLRDPHGSVSSRLRTAASQSASSESRRSARRKRRSAPRSSSRQKRSAAAAVAVRVARGHHGSTPASAPGSTSS